MKNVLRIVLLMLVGGILSGYLSSAMSASNLNSSPIRYNNPEPPVLNMVFPVAGKKARIGSFWGAIRDGGTRKHEGIDIFAAKKTPVVAVKDGVITTIGTGGRGGKYIWLKTSDDEFIYYYAHLDQQLVKPGQSVKAGQIIGTVGNTGNAKLTPPHLHFGMYSYEGAIDPLPFVKKLPRLPVTTATKKNLASKTRSVRSAG